MKSSMKYKSCAMHIHTKQQTSTLTPKAVVTTYQVRIRQEMFAVVDDGGLVAVRHSDLQQMAGDSAFCTVD